MMDGVRVVVVGAGVVGFSTAVCIAENLPHVSVTLLGEKFSPETTSDGAAGILFANHNPDVPVEQQRRWFKSSFDHLRLIAQSEDAPEAGVMLSSGWQIFRDVPEDKTPYWSDLVLGFRIMTERELVRFPEHRFGQAFTTIKCECSRYLPWLEKRFRRAGGQVEQRRVDNLQDLSGSFDVIVNCSGLGSRSLAGDVSVQPVRGQVLKMEAPWLQHFIRDGDGLTYIFPGIQGVTIGGTRQGGDWNLQVDENDTRGILKRCSSLEPSLKRARILSSWVGLRPDRKTPRVEVEREVEVKKGGRSVTVVHNYGHGGVGVTLSWGTAMEALGLVKKSLQETKRDKAKL
ncbi:hypothetical protein OYC64_009063 [Pagothenia borchgrevinki]|uniref:D-aspartate oxidase n=1 Tax=Pagothenia borchgrevinki TaxID=8213 RepID=A0ABD2G751_PAGBO